MNLELIFDNGGGLTIQRDDYVHCYEDMEQAANDYRELLKFTSVADWDGNELDNRIEPDDDVIRNGGYVVFSASHELDPERYFGWRNIDDFQRAYFGVAYTASAD